MLTLLELLLPEVAAHHRVAVLIDAIDEVLAGHAHHASLPVLQVSIVDKTPLLHGRAVQYSSTSRGIVKASAATSEENLWQASPMSG